MTTQPGHILVIDDDMIDSMVLLHQLEAEGYRVTTVDDGRRALELLRSQPFDLVLLDMLMPDMDGTQVLQTMKTDPQLRHVPVIMVSGLDEIGAIVRCIELGATDYLTKPFDVVMLRARVSASLAEKRMHDQEEEYLRQVTLLTQAAVQIEGGSYDPAQLSGVEARGDALGQLARVFQRMAQELMARERHLQQQNQFKSALISKISRELRSPFVAANLSMQVLKRYAEHRMVSELPAQLRVLDRQITEGRQMIDTLIAFASLVSRQTQLQLVAEDIVPVIWDAVKPLQRMAAARDVELSFEIAQPQPLVRIDRERLGEAIHHLVHNAIKFNRAGGVVKIACWPAGPQVLFSVEDTGCGIAEAEMSTIWDAFAQVAEKDPQHTDGPGIGLALVKHIIEAHQGAVFAKSTLGAGSVFGFHLLVAR